eukprot:TRINITY_DN20056_c0_g1_i1.p2 TRINITY_DN20056_c0_g1~~TRINITY_DN20056_c0_g1_i1.p2  ORF type:complete len:133 (-),score=28.51 TRINITY_DN20056_c0_g1_i1:33-431(-)
MEKNIFTDILEGEFKECLNIPSQHCCYFKYDAGSKAKLLKFFVEPLDANSDPDIYITADDPGVSQKHYHWKANNIGSVQANVNPFDPHYTTPVSYTHLTLPTILLVQISVVAVSLKKKKIQYMKNDHPEAQQ